MIPKLRAWDDDSLSMRMVKAIVLEDGEFVRVIFTGGDVKPGYNPKWRGWSYIHKTKLMEFIGVSDINKTDVYEGDILTDEFHRVLLVERGRGGFRFKAVTETNFLYAYGIMQWFDGGTILPRIIGNIYENPEMLELLVESHE